MVTLDPDQVESLLAWMNADPSLPQGAPEDDPNQVAQLDVGAEGAEGAAGDGKGDAAAAEAPGAAANDAIQGVPGGCGGGGDDVQGVANEAPAEDPATPLSPGTDKPNPAPAVVAPGTETSVAELEARFGMRITGATTPESLSTLNQALSMYQPQHYQGMQQINLIDLGRGLQNGDVAGTWGSQTTRGIFEDGRSGLPEFFGINLYAFVPSQGGPSQIGLWPAVHEIAHNVNELTRPQFRNQFVRALLSESGPGPFPTPYSGMDPRGVVEFFPDPSLDGRVLDPNLANQVGAQEANRLAQTYVQTSEFAAENTTVMMLGPNSDPAFIEFSRVYQTYSPAAQAKQIFQSEFGTIAPNVP